MKRVNFTLRFSFVLALLATSLLVFAQSLSVSGVVFDKDNDEVLPGVTVMLSGTGEGTITDIDGQFSITVASGQQLSFSFIGYKTQTVSVNVATLDVYLESDVALLGEVIAIGYGVQKKEDKTGAVAQIKAEELNGGALTDALQAIQGKSAGVMVTKKGGDPNAGFSVKIRGSAGFDSNTEPLYVVDGITGVDASTVAPEDILTMDVLKDAASTAIYGSRGANGVIIITTKKGGMDGDNCGAKQVQFSAKLTFDQVAKRLDLLSADELRQYASDNGMTEFVDGGADTDWQDEIFQAGVSQNYNVNFSGGSKNSSYYASLTRADWEGVVKGTEKARTIAKVNLMHKAFEDRLTLSGTLSQTFENNDYESYSGYNKEDILYQAFSRNPTDPVYNADGSYYKTTREFNYENPVATINEIDNTRDAKRFMGNIKADLELTEGLVASVNGSYLRDDHESYYFRPKNLYSAADVGSASRSYGNSSQKMIEATVNYVKTFDNVHNLNVLGGYTWQEREYDGFNAGGSNPQSDYIGANNLGGTLLDVTRNDVGSYRGMSRLIGFFGRAQYNYMQKYYASASIRRDGSTKFGENNKWGWFPTAAAGWTLSREPFMEDLDWLDNLKVRVSYGVSGNQEIGEYNSQVRFVSSGAATNPETGLQVITYGPASNENPDLRWEKSSETNIGIDFAFLNSKLSGSLELYSKLTNDMLGAYSVPVPPNLASTTFANSGSMTNKGVELTVQYFAVDESNFKWKTIINASHNSQKMEDLGEYAPEDGFFKEGYLSMRGLIGNQNYVTGVIEGESLGSFYLPEYRGLSSDGAFLYTSNSGGVTRELSSARRSIVGDGLPTVEVGWTNNFTIYKNWTLDMSIRALIGNDVYNATRMFFDYPGNIPTLNGMPDAIEWQNQGRTNPPAIADMYVEDGTFVRLDFVQLGYNFDLENVSFLSSLKAYVSGNNLLTITNYSGVDPETSMSGKAFGIDQFNVYPKTRNFTFGLTATF